MPNSAEFADEDGTEKAVKRLSGEVEKSRLVEEEGHTMGQGQAGAVKTSVVSVSHRKPSFDYKTTNRKMDNGRNSKTTWTCCEKLHLCKHSKRNQSRMPLLTR